MQNVKLAKEYFNSLNREGFKTLSEERIIDIINIAKLYHESKKTVWYDLTIKYKFYEIINKIQNCKDNTFVCGKILANSYDKHIIFENDDEKILLILAFCDPNNILLKTWSSIKQRLVQDSDKNTLTTSNYLKT